MTGQIIRTTIKHRLRQLGLEVKRVDKDAPIGIRSEIPEIDEADISLINLVSAYSMGNPLRHWALLNSVRWVCNQGVPGDLVECGVWRGGNLILMALASAGSIGPTARKVWGYDTFEGMTEPTDVDIEFHTGELAVDEYSRRQTRSGSDWCLATIDEVNFNVTEHCKTAPVSLVKGPVETTLLQEENLPKAISVLRLDTDWYESTALELEVLFPRLAVGGILIIDDYGYWSGARKAVDDYFRHQAVFLHRIDHSCRLVVKA